MDLVRDFYSVTGIWWGGAESGITGARPPLMPSGPLTNTSRCWFASAIDAGPEPGRGGGDRRSGCVTGTTGRSRNSWLQ